MLSFGLIFVAAIILAGLGVAGVRAHREEYLLVLNVHGAGIFLFERLDTGRYDRIAAWQLPAVAVRYAARTPVVVRRPSLRTPRPAPALART
jgi:hypothetical protein